MTVYLKCLDDPSCSVILNDIHTVNLGDVDGVLCILTCQSDYWFEYRLGWDLDTCLRSMDLLIDHERVILEFNSSDLSISSGKY